MNKYSFLQCLEVVPQDTKYDFGIFGQYYKIPKSGVTPVIECSGTEYKYDFGRKEIILLDVDGKEVSRKQVEPKLLARSEWKWLKIAKEEARISLGLEEIY